MYSSKLSLWEGAVVGIITEAKAEVIPRMADRSRKESETIDNASRVEATKDHRTLIPDIRFFVICI
jgi:hypothetical protein